MRQHTSYTQCTSYDFILLAFSEDMKSYFIHSEGMNFIEKNTSPECFLNAQTSPRFKSCYSIKKEQTSARLICSFLVGALRKHSGEVFLAKSGEAGTERIALGRRAGKCEQRETFRKTVTPTK